MQLHLQLWQEMISLCQSLNQDQYTHKSRWLNGATIAAHIRHSYEFYRCLIEGNAQGEINYENRQRNKKIETDLAYSLQKLTELNTQLKEVVPNEKIILVSKETERSTISTSFHRELLYCLDHAIHHQALIKIGLKELGLSHLVNANFGVAYSTLRYQERD